MVRRQQPVNGKRDVFLNHLLQVKEMSGLNDRMLKCACNNSIQEIVR